MALKVSLASTAPKNQPLVAFAFEKDPAPIGLPQQKKLMDEAAQEGFKGKDGSTVLLHPKSGSPARWVILAGLGDRKKFTAETLRRAGAAALRKASAADQKSVTVLPPQSLGGAEKDVRVLTEGMMLAAYQFAKYKSEKKPGVKEAAVVVPQKLQNEARKGLRQGQVEAEAAAFVRDLVNEPPSDLPPSRVAALAHEIAEKGKAAGVSVQVFEKEQIQEMGMGALLGVNRGSAEPPAFIHLHYKPENAAKSIALVGKGITFDSGGLSLKPAQSMETMKMDMAGAAAILGVFRAIPSLKPKVEVHGILAVTENMPGGRAIKPGDVLKAMNGKTIEVLNTDAEGRLVLSDALSYAVRQKPGAIIDLATLTGACITALGSLVAGAMGNDESLLNDLRKAGEESGEQFWPLPLVPEYKEGLQSKIADLQNISSVRGEAGSIIGGLFLQEFVDGKPWVHLDIAGPAWSAKDFYYLTPGGTGFAVRTLLHYLLSF